MSGGYLTINALTCIPFDKLRANGLIQRFFKFTGALILALSAHGALAAPETQPLLRGSYQKIIAAHAGKPFIVALWSVSCTHCGADLEIFKRLAQKYEDFNLVLISTDSPEQEAIIARTLQRYNLAQGGQKRLAKVESWVFADSYTERLHFEIDPKWYGELPRTYLFDAKGKVTAISGVLDEAQTERWVRGS
jgi:thiol-disulfide isomerase/thioredoxin